jgi:2-dehydro-3-deoxyphosphogluconate aldolase/(4S)-4-hydroxy-2-oxoglutarate aldolase
VLFIPGAATPTEIDRARSLGCEIVKIFPAALLGGPAYIRAVSAVFPDVRFLPTGGVNETNVDEYLALPSVVACAGTWLKP